MEGQLISSEMADALNAQIGHELEASLQYTSIASYFALENLFLLAKLFRDQATEERDHALKLADYLVKAGASVRIPAIAATRADFESCEAAVALALEWEMDVANQYDSLMELGARLRDYLAQEFLGWFVTEQLEEVSKMRRILDVVRRSGTNLLMVEAYLGHDESGIS